MDTFPRRWAFRTAVYSEGKNTNYGTSRREYLFDTGYGNVNQHDGIHMGAYQKAMADIARFKERVLKTFDIG